MAKTQTVYYATPSSEVTLSQYPSPIALGHVPVPHHTLAHRRSDSGGAGKGAWRRQHTPVRMEHGLPRLPHGLPVGAALGDEKTHVVEPLLLP